MGKLAQRILEARALIGGRVYKYTDQEGVVYYSFHLHPSKVTPHRNLVLDSRLGVNVINFLTAIRRKVDSGEIEG